MKKRREPTEAELNSKRANAIADAKKRATAEGTNDPEMQIDLSESAKEKAHAKATERNTPAT